MNALKIKKILTIGQGFIVGLVMFFGVLSPALVFAVDPAPTAAKTAACAGVESVGGTCDEATADKGVSDIFKTVINILSIIIGAVSVIMIIIGGIRYVVSGGDSAGVAGAKNTILYAVVGLVVALFAQVIVQFVLTNAQTT